MRQSIAIAVGLQLRQTYTQRQPSAERRETAAAALNGREKAAAALNGKRRLRYEGRETATAALNGRDGVGSWGRRRRGGESGWKGEEPSVKWEGVIFILGNLHLWPNWRKMWRMFFPLRHQAFFMIVLALRLMENVALFFLWSCYPFKPTESLLTLVTRSHFSIVLFLVF